MKLHILILTQSHEAAECEFICIIYVRKGILLSELEMCILRLMVWEDTDPTEPHKPTHPALYLSASVRFLNLFSHYSHRCLRFSWMLWNIL